MKRNQLWAGKTENLRQLKKNNSSRDQRTQNNKDVPWTNAIDKKIKSRGCADQKNISPQNFFENLARFSCELLEELTHSFVIFVWEETLLFNRFRCKIFFRQLFQGCGSIILILLSTNTLTFMTKSRITMLKNGDGKMTKLV